MTTTTIPRHWGGGSFNVTLPLLTHARLIIQAYGAPDDGKLSPADAAAYDEALDAAATVAAGTPTMTDWRSSVGTVVATPAVRRWLAARDAFPDLMRAVDRHDRLVHGDVDLWKEFRVVSTDTGRASALTIAEDDVETCLQIILAVVGA